MDEKKSTYLENAVSNLFNTAKKYGRIQFKSQEEEQNLKSELIELQKKLIIMYSQKGSLIEDSRYLGHVGQSKSDKKYYKKTAKEATKNLKKLNKELEPLEARYKAILNKIRNNRA